MQQTRENSLQSGITVKKLIPRTKIFTLQRFRGGFFLSIKYKGNKNFSKFYLNKFLGLPWFVIKTKFNVDYFSISDVFLV